MSWVWGWRGTNRAGGKVADDYPAGGHPADDLWRLVQPEPPAVSITITNMTAEARTTIATTGTKLDAVDTTDAVMAEIVANRALRGRVRPGSRLGLDARRRRGDLLIKIRGQRHRCGGHSCTYGESATAGHGE